MQVALPELGALPLPPVTQVLRAPVPVPVLQAPQAGACGLTVVLVVLEGNIFFLDLCGGPKFCALELA